MDSIQSAVTNAIGILFILTVVGIIGINKSGNYENIWGRCFWYGGVALIIGIVVKVIMLIASLV